jgi:hypothetical protein
MCLLMCGCDWCDPDNGDVVTPAPYAFTITDACKATDASGAEIAQLDLVAGQTVEYCNNWSAKAQVKFSVVGFLPGGAVDLTLEAGECKTHVVDAGVVDGNYSWSLSCEGYSGGMGGGPVKVDNPPPGGP